MMPMPGGAVVIPATIDNTPRNLLIDTAGVTSSLTPKVVADLNLTPSASGAGPDQYTVTGKLERQFVNIKTFNIGGMGGSNVSFLVDTQMGYHGDVIGGRLSPDLLQNFDLDFDFAAGKLNLFSPEHCAGRVVYWTNSYAQIPFKTTRDGKILLDVTLDGKNLTALIDTGTSASYLSKSMANLAFGVNEDSPGIERTPGAQADDLVQYRYHFKSLALNSINVSNPLLYLLPDTAEDAIKEKYGKSADDPVNGVMYRLNIPRITIGLDILRRLHVYIAYGEKNIYVSAVGANASSDNAKPGGNKP